MIPAYVEHTISSNPGEATTPPCTDVILSLQLYKTGNILYIF